MFTKKEGLYELWKLLPHRCFHYCKEDSYNIKLGGASACGRKGSSKQERPCTKANVHLSQPWKEVIAISAYSGDGNQGPPVVFSSSIPSFTRWNACVHRALPVSCSTRRCFGGPGPAPWSTLSRAACCLSGRQSVLRPRDHAGRTVAREDRGP